MKDALAEASAASSELDAIDGQLCAALVAIEDGIRAHVSSRIETVCSGEQFSRLAFGKNDGAWGLIVETAGGWCLVRKCSREIRAAVLGGGHVRRLIEQSAAQIRSNVAKRSEATSAAQELLSMLSQQTTKES